MEYIDTAVAAQMLGVGQRRVLYLLHQKRIKGAYKKDRSWVIPLYRGKPKVFRRHRGPQPRWSKLGAGGRKIIYVDKNCIKTNEKKVKEIKKSGGAEIPLKTVVSVDKSGHRRVIRCHELEIFGYCRIIYQPYNARDCGASLWIETYSGVKTVKKSELDPEQWSVLYC
ncbi:MAG: hypothetical protein WA865_13315 [Spirulinaceae cyanobacterium]